jgi:hypothetical protein
MKRTHHPRPSFSHAVGGAALAVIIAVLAAACGSGSGKGSATGSRSPTASASSAFEQAIALARCVRAHGAPDFPDPNSDGSFPSGHGDLPPSAVRACGNLIRAGKQPHLAQQQQQYPKMLEVARCVRAHGYPTFPDPPPPGSQARQSAPAGIDLNSPQFSAVLSSCNRRYFGSSSPPGAAVAPTRNG